MAFTKKNQFIWAVTATLLLGSSATWAQLSPFGAGSSVLGGDFSAGAPSSGLGRPSGAAGVSPQVNGASSSSSIDSNSTLAKPEIKNVQDVSVNKANFSNPKSPTADPSAADRVAPPPPSDFERFVTVSTGKTVKPFGSNLFASSFGNVTNVPVPADYTVGPGDELQIRAWGSIDVDYRTVVDRNGQISLPRVGTFSVAGVKSSELETVLKGQIGKYFTNFQLSATLGQLRGLQIYVVGQAAAPGLYNVGSLSTLVSAIFQVALPGTNGSYRTIQLKRNNKVVAEFDLYDFVANGDTGKDMRLASGDVIVIPPAGPRVAVLGAVDNQAIFELKVDKSGNAENISSILKLAGNTRALTNGSRVQLERIDPANVRAPRLVDNLDLKIGGDIRMTDSDIVTVFPSSPKFSNAVTLRGNVASPLRYAYKPGMRIRDVIPEKEALITTDYYTKKNALVQVIADRKVTDTKVENDVRNNLSEVNFDYAVVERLDTDRIRTKLIPFNLGLVLADPTSTENIELLPGDVITIFGVNDVSVPKSRRTAIVRVAGEVASPGIYQLLPGETLPQLIRRIGGFSKDAFEYGMSLTRESTRKDQEKRYEEAVNRIERDLQQSQIVTAQSVLAPEDASTKATQLQAQKALVDRLRAVKPTGRIVLEIPEDAARPEDLPNLALEDGDQINVPAVPDTVNVFGSVFGEGAFLYQTRRSVGDMVALAGGPTRGADTGSTFVIRANGQVVSNRQGGLRFLMGLDGLKALPGDTVFVPEDFERTPFMKSVKDIAQVFGQFAIGAAAVKVLKN